MTEAASPRQRGSVGGRRAPAVDRSFDRAVTAGGLGISLLFVIAAIISLVWPGATARGDWLPLHLTLAGAAATAIAAAAPFFSATSAAAPPAAPAWRIAAVGLVSSGAAAVTFGVSSGASAVAIAGGGMFIGGGGALLVSVLVPHRRSLTGQRRFVTVTYGVAAVDVMIGVGLATLALGGWAPIVEHWAQLKPAHATLNLFGFVSLVIAGTLLHLYPTVLGARISARRTALTAVAGLVVGPPVVALGFALGSSALARLGAGAVLVGAGALAIQAATLYRRRATWTTDHGWHRMAIGSLGAAHAWFVVGVLAFTARIGIHGAVPAGWSIDPLLGPIVIGWVVQALVGAGTHLIPVIGPGGPSTHAVQRAILGRLATLRVVAFQVGTLFVTVGSAASAPILAWSGAALVATVVLAMGGLGSAALVIGLRAARNH